MRNFHRRPVTYAFYQVSIHLAERFQWRRFNSEKVTEKGRQTTYDGRQVMSKAHFTFGRILSPNYTEKLS